MWLSDLRILDLLEALLELAPVPHDDLGAALSEHLLHLGLHLFSFITANIPDDVDTGVVGTPDTALAILDRHTLLRLHADDLAGMEVDGRIRLAGRLGQGRGSAEDVIVGEILILIDLFDRRLDSRDGGRGHNRHPVLLRFGQLLQLFVAADAGFGLCGQGLDDALELLFDVVVELVFSHLEVVFLLQGDHHAAEVLADKVDEELGSGVVGIDLVFFEDLIGKFGAGFEGEFFGEDQRVVAVEEELFDLCGGISTVVPLIRLLGGASSFTLGILN